MSASPQKEGDGEADVAQSPGDQEQQEQQKPQAEEEQQNPDNNNIMHDPNSLYETEVKEQDRWLPIANVARIMKTALPENAKIAKEAKECMQECVSEFISFITSEASEKCQHEKRKTVNGEDILFAMTSLGFENYSEALKIYLARFRDSNVTKNENQANRPASGHGAAGGQETRPNVVQSPEASAAVGGLGGDLTHGTATAANATAAAAGVAVGTGGSGMTMQNGGATTAAFGDGSQSLGASGLGTGAGENGSFEGYAVGAGATY